MPRNNRFQHQSYPTVPVLKTDVRRLSVESKNAVDFERLHDGFRIHHVELVHGTFAGSDPFGVNAMLKMLAEETSRPVRVPLKLVIDKLSDAIRNVSQRVTGSVANYSEDYERSFQDLVGGADADPQVSRLNPTWSSENNHLARAELAVRLICRLDDLRNEGLNPADERVMLWGYSHAAAGLALLTNLLANHVPSVDAFFDAAGDSLGEPGRRARAILAAERGPHSLAKCLVLVTFGGPVRYGWDTDGYRYLMHVIHHRAFDDNEPTRSVPAVQIGCAGKGVLNNLEAVSGGLLDILNARHGDWVQLFAIAGTDLRSLAHREADARLGRFLESGLPRTTPDKLKERLKVVCSRWQSATRLHTDGRNVLVDFEQTETTRFGPAHQAVLGHGIYTLPAWLPRQLELVMEWMERDGLGRE